MDYLRDLVKKKIENIENLQNINTKETLEELKKYKLIEEILKDNACFFKINCHIAYSILIELGVDNPNEYYKRLISYEEYKKNKENFD